MNNEYNNQPGENTDNNLNSNNSVYTNYNVDSNNSMNDNKSMDVNNNVPVNNSVDVNYKVNANNTVNAYDTVNANNNVDVSNNVNMSSSINPSYRVPSNNSMYYNNQVLSNDYNNQYNENGNVSFYGSTNNSYQNYSPYTVTPTPPNPKEKKPKRKSKFLGVLKFTAAAIIFGLIAGVAFQGYYYLTKPETETSKVTEDSDEKLQLTEDKEGTNDKDTIVPANISADKVVTDVSDVVEKVMPSIVAINASGTVTNYDFFNREYAEPIQGSGSGFVIGQNESKILIVTNNHVIQGSENREVVFADGTTASAEIKGADAKADLAVISVDIKDLSKETLDTIKVATLGNSDDIKAGQMVIAIGNALGYGQSVTVGYVSAVNREVYIEDQTMTLLQTDAAINPGNSGGALINTEGQVVGINSVKYASEEVEGMGYAIPITNALPMIRELMNRELIAEGEKGYLGIDVSTAQDVTEENAELFNMPIGVYINDVVPNSPAEAAGLEQGNIITGIDDVKIETIEDLKNALGYKKEGQEITLKLQVKEDGAYVEKILQVTLGER